MPRATTLQKKPIPKKAITRKPIVKTIPRTQMPSVWELTKKCISVLWPERWLFLGIIGTFGLVDLVLAKGFTIGASSSSQLISGSVPKLGVGLITYAQMLATIGNGSSGGGFGFSLVLTIFASLAIIWSLRNSSNKVKVGLRDAYYRGMYPLIPFVIILSIIGLELLPLIGGLTVYITAMNSSIALDSIEKLVFLVLLFVLAVITMFWLSSSVFALYISTLPDMTPIKALRSAKVLVKKRRLAVILRILFLPFVLLLVSLAIMLPIIIFVPVMASWVFFVLSLLMLLVFHSYMYNFYRELIA